MKTSIQVSEKVRGDLVKLKYRLKAKDYDEVIEKLLNLVKKFKLAEELK